MDKNQQSDKPPSQIKRKCTYGTMNFSKKIHPNPTVENLSTVEVPSTTTVTPEKVNVNKPTAVATTSTSAAQSVPVPVVLDNTSGPSSAPLNSVSFFLRS
jgi:hypothetical protein